MLYQEKFQDLQDFRDEKVCHDLGLKFGRCEDNAREILKEKGITEPTTAQLKDATDKFGGLQTILFLYKIYKSKYGKFIEEMENDVLQRKDPFPKKVFDACRVLSGWKNQHGNKETMFTRKMMAWHSRQQAMRKKGDKKKEVTYYKCWKAGHYSNECYEVETVKTSNTGKKGSSFLVLNKSQMTEESAGADYAGNIYYVIENAEKEQERDPSTDTDTDEEEEPC